MGIKIQNRWSVFKENHPNAHICVLIVAVNIVFILGSSLLISILPENRGHSIAELLRLAFTLMVNPSGKYIYSETPISLIVTTIVVLLGMISLTGGTVGFITSIISGFLEKTANSKRTLKLNDHIVILNYNQRVPAILADFCYDDVDSTYVVILTNEDRESVLHRIEENYNQLGDVKHFRNLIIRTGSPMSRIDLDRIALSRAKTVFIMTPNIISQTNAVSREETGFIVSKLFMFVTGYLSECGMHSTTDVIVETSDVNMDEMVHNYHLNSLERNAMGIQYSKIVGKILSVTVIMPAINEVLRQLFSFEGIEVYSREISDKTVKEELKCSRSAVPLFERDGRRVFLAEDESEIFKHTEEYLLKKQLPEGNWVPNISFSKSEIVIIGINSKLPYILESLACFKREYNNGDLHVILADTSEKKTELDALYHDSRYASILAPEKYEPVIIRNMYHPMDELQEYVNNSGDVLLFLSDDISDLRIDEKPLLYWTGIQSKMASKDNLDIVVEIRDPENQSIIKRKNKDQILVSDDFLGHLYAQLGKNPLRLDIIMDLITSDGDAASRNSNSELQNEGDLLCLNVKSFFEGCNTDLVFTSKRELILWVYEATKKKVITLGCVKKGKVFLFARTDSTDDGLDSCILLGEKEGDIYDTKAHEITLDPEDEIIVFLYK